MSQDLLQEIEQRFQDNDYEDQEFFTTPREQPFSVISPRSLAPTVLFSAKPVHFFHNIDITQNLPPDDLMIVGRNGLPSLYDVAWITRLSAARTIYFLGDLDPIGLLTFAWMRLQSPELTLQYVGVSDNLIQAAGMPFSSNMMINYARDEREAKDLVKRALPDLKELVGHECHQLLDQEKKIEIEALISCGPTFLSALYEKCRAD